MRCFLHFAATLALVCPSLAAAAEEVTEHELKAAIAHKITKFVSWPDGAFDSPEAPIRFCVVDEGPIRDALQQMQGFAVHGRSVQIAQLEEPAGVAERCNVLYLSRGAAENPGEWLAGIAESPVLTIGETTASDGYASMVTLSIRRNRVRFDIDKRACERAGLTIGAPLLQLLEIQKRR